MTVNDNLNTFLGKTIIDYNPDSGIQNLAKYAYRIKIDYDEYSGDVKIIDKIEAFANDPAAVEVTELIIGAYDYESSTDSSDIVSKLVEVKEKLPNLKALFIGDIIAEESEISWIQQTDIGSIVTEFPNLEHLQVRGGEGLQFSNLNHNKLKTLIIETGGMPPNVVTEVNNAQLPALEKLELWFGDDNYGFDSTVSDMGNLISGKTFPALKYLGLMNSIIQDDIAIAVAQSPVLDQLDTLDLSMGILTDTGAQALLDSPGIKKLKHLNLRHHFMSDAMIDKINGLGISVDASGQEQEDDEYKFIEVSE